jgi:hypothetical protein
MVHLYATFDKLLSHLNREYFKSLFSLPKTSLPIQTVLGLQTIIKFELIFWDKKIHETCCAQELAGNATKTEVKRKYLLFLSAEFVTEKENLVWV